MEIVVRTTAYDAEELKNVMKEVQEAIKECSQVTGCTVEIDYVPTAVQAVTCPSP